MSENNEPEDDDKQPNPYDAIDENDNFEALNRDYDQPDGDLRTFRR